MMGKIRPDQKLITKGLAQLGIEHLDGVLLTHTHYDHALDAAEVISQAGSALYGSGSALNLLKGAGLGTDCGVEVVPGQTYAIGVFRVCFHPARHLPFPLPVSRLCSYHVPNGFSSRIGITSLALPPDTASLYRLPVGAYAGSQPLAPAWGSTSIGLNTEYPSGCDRAEESQSSTMLKSAYN